MEYRKKKGNQQAIKEPMIKPKISVARLSFFRAIRFFSFSASCSGVSLGAAGVATGLALEGVGLLLPTVLQASPMMVVLLSIFFRIPLRGLRFLLFPLLILPMSMTSRVSLEGRRLLTAPRSFDRNLNFKQLDFEVEVLLVTLELSFLISFSQVWLSSLVLTPTERRTRG